MSTLGLLILLSNPTSTAVVLAESAPAPSRPTDDMRVSNTVTKYYSYLPHISTMPAACPALTGETYGSVTPDPPPTDRPAEEHADLNLALRGYTNTNAYLGLVNYDGPVDPNAPQLPGLFTNNRTASFTGAYQVYDWDWTCNCRGAPIDTFPVTLAGLATARTETIRVPGPIDIGTMPSGYAAMVLYANINRITLKYTRADNVVLGYTLHLENICVEPRLLSLYRSLNASGRASLPALFAGQGMGTATGTELGVAVRDNGNFLDPRSRKDWWQGR